MGGFSIGYGIGIGPTSRGFSPLSISGLQLWLDANDSNTLYDATSGGSLVISDGSAVKRWEDKSGNARHAIEATNAPTLEVAEKNGLNALNFATGKYLTSSFSNLTLTSETVFVVFKFSSTMSSFGRIFTQSITNENDYSISGHYIPFLRNSSLAAICSYASSGQRSAISVLNNAWYIGRSRHSGSALTVKLNTIEGESYSHTLNRAFNKFRVGGAYTGPSGGTDSAVFNSVACEVIVYDKSLSDSESTQVTDYLNSKWAIY